MLPAAAGSAVLAIAGRTVVIYAVVLIGVRLSGKREVGQMTPFDLTLLLLLSNSVQNAMAVLALEQDERILTPVLGGQDNNRAGMPDDFAQGTDAGRLQNLFRGDPEGGSFVDELAGKYSGGFAFWSGLLLLFQRHDSIRLEPLETRQKRNY